LLLEQQLKNARMEGEELKGEVEDVKRELAKVTKKYGKAKERRECDKCRAREELGVQLEKEREIYANDRKMLQDEIKTLKKEL
jgi:hypothetical protein